MLSEIRKQGKGNCYEDEYIYFSSGVEKSKLAKDGISIAVKKVHGKIDNWLEPCYEWIITVNMKIRGREIRNLASMLPQMTRI